MMTDHEIEEAARILCKSRGWQEDEDIGQVDYPEHYETGLDVCKFEIRMVSEVLEAIASITGEK